MFFIISIVLYALLLIFNILSRIFLPLCIYNDAKAHNNKNTVIFTVFSIFFPFITGIVYLCLRKNPGQRIMPQVKTCTQCGNLCFVRDYACSQCGNTQFVYADIPVPNQSKRKSNAKKFLICWIVSVALSIIFSVIFGITTFASLNSGDFQSDIDRYFNNHRYNDEIEDYFENYYENYYDGYNCD